MPKLLTAKDVRGIMPPLVTPFTTSEDLDLPSFRKEVAYMHHLGVKGVSVGGSTGEGWSLSAEELSALVTEAADVLQGAIPIIAGIITSNTRDAVKKAIAAREAGANAVMVTPPIYLQPSEAGISSFYEALYKESGMPIILYNVLTHLPITPAMMKAMVAVNPGMIGTKESIGSGLEGLGHLIRDLGDKIAVTWAHDWCLFPGLVIGAVGSISGASAILPKHTLVMFDAIQTGDLKTAQELHYVISAVADEISRSNWIGGVKWVVNQQGRQCGLCRRPFIEPGLEQQARIRKALNAALAYDFPKVRESVPA